MGLNTFEVEVVPVLCSQCVEAPFNNKYCLTWEYNCLQKL